MIIATNVDNTYWNTKHHALIDSVTANKQSNDMFVAMLVDNGTSFIDSQSNINNVIIDIDSIKHSRHTNLKNRPNFVCLESGEFVDHTSFDDNEILIMCDWDVVMQRKFTDHEVNIINNLSSTKFGMNKDCYPENKLYGYLGIENIFNDVSKDWIVYNTGIQVARISAWKELYNHWKRLAPKMYAGCRHHAAGQALFNYIVQKYDMVQEMPLSFHNAHWFQGTQANRVNNSLYVNNELVLFNHHKWQYIPKF